VLLQPVTRSSTRPWPLTDTTLQQGEFVDKLAELVIKTYGASNGVAKGDVYCIQVRCGVGCVARAKTKRPPRVPGAQALPSCAARLTSAALQLHNLAAACCLLLLLLLLHMTHHASHATQGKSKVPFFDDGGSDEEGGA
jgi:hypothetical protein